MKPSVGGGGGRLCELGGVRPRVSKGRWSWRDSGLAAGLEGVCNGVSHRPALSPPTLELSSWGAGSFTLLTYKANIQSYVWWYNCSRTQTRLICLWLPGAAPKGHV